MRRRVPFGVLVLVVGAGLGIAIAGEPDFGKKPVEVRTDDAASGTDSPSGETTTTTEVTSTSPVAGGSPSSSTTTAVDRDVRVRAYNSSSTAGAAGDVSARLKTAGYTMLPAATGPKDRTGQTRVLFKPGFDSVANSLAAELDVPADRVNALGAEKLPSVEDTDVMVLVGDDIA